MRAALVAQPACTCWFGFYFDFIFVLLFFLGVVPFTGFESSLRTVADSFTVSILYRDAVRAKFESFASD